MKINEIQDLIKFVAKSGVSEVELESDGFKLVIKTPPNRRGAKGQVDMPATILQTQVPVAGVQQMHAMPVPAPAPVAAAPVAPEKTEEEDDKYLTIKSPMIGTFYRKPAPDKANFVEVGDDISPGLTVCVIEAMKLFNEIEAEVSGKIVKILVDDNSPVEYDQPLFLVDPK